MSDQDFSASARIERAALLIQARRHDLAAEECQAVLAIEPDNPDAYRLLGCVRHEKGENRQALDLLEKAIALAPEDSRSWMLKAHVYAAWPTIWKHRALKKARSAAEEALRLAPSDARVFGLLAWLHNLAHKPTKALKYAEDGLAIDPQHENCLLQKIQALQEKQNWKRSEEAVGTLLEINPASATTHHVGGMQALADGRFKQAAEHFQDASSLVPSDKDFQIGYVSSKRAQFFGMGLMQRLSIRYAQLHLSWRILLVVSILTLLFCWGMGLYPEIIIAIICVIIGWRFLVISYGLAVDLWLAATDKLFRFCLPGKRRRFACAVWTMIHWFITHGVGVMGGFGLRENSRSLWVLAPFIFTCLGYFPMSRIRSKFWRIAGFSVLALLAILSVIGFVVKTLNILPQSLQPTFKDALPGAFIVWIFGTTATHMLAIAAITKSPKD